MPTGDYVCRGHAGCHRCNCQPPIILRRPPGTEWPDLADSRPAGHDPKRVVSVSVLDMPYIQALLAACLDLLAAVDAEGASDGPVADAAAEVHRVIDQHTQETDA